MNITIIGAGNIGGTLGKKWAAAGHQIWFGVRNPDRSKFDELRSVGEICAIDQALKHGEVVLLAQPGDAVADFAATHGATLADKTVIDATNNIHGRDFHSLALLAEKAPTAQLVRAFNNLGWECFKSPSINGEPIDLFYCAHAASRPVADKLIADAGLRPIYIGDVDTAPVVDGIARLWFSLVFGQKHGRHLAFKLMEEN